MISLPSGWRSTARAVGSGFGSKQSMRTHEPNLVVRRNVADSASLRRAGRAYALHPVAIFVFFWSILLVATGLMRPEYPALPNSLARALLCAKILAYWGFLMVAVGPLAGVLMRRNLPFALVPVALWASAVLLSAVLSEILLPFHDWSSMRLATQFLLGATGALTILWMGETSLKPLLGARPDLVPYWKPVTVAQDILTHGSPALAVPEPVIMPTDAPAPAVAVPAATPTVALEPVTTLPVIPWLDQLPAERRGRLRRIHAANQYVEVVTDRGSAMVRMSFRDAVAALPEALGWVCHRSMWIARDEIAWVGYDKGRAMLTDKDGKCFPVSRKMVDALRAHPNTEPR